jgi:hypothetical protein
LEAGASHAFAKAALGKKILLEPPELLVEQVVSLVNQADEGVGDDLERSSLEIGPIGLIGLI